jgi:hypothetical protein
MKILLAILFFAFSQTVLFAQETFTSRKGSKFFPGHLDIVITLDSNKLRYELFNHWYSRSYAELRQLTIQLDSLEMFNNGNDSIKIELQNNKVKLIDKKYSLKRKIKHRRLCASTETMRKISFAYKVSSRHEGVRHFALYEPEDLNLSEKEFEQVVLKNLKEKLE